MENKRSHSVPLLVSKKCHNEVLQIGWLTQEKFVVSQFWGLEGRDQGVGGVGSFRDL